MRQRQTSGKVDNASSNLIDSKRHTPRELLYGVNDIPPWYTSIILGFQVSVFEQKLKAIILGFHVARRPCRYI